jgi:hypothetical protein
MISSFLFGIKMRRVKDIALFAFPNIHVAVTPFEVKNTMRTFLSHWYTKAVIY